MSKKNAVNQFALSLIMGLIIVAFVFTGVQSFTNSAGEVASVDGTAVEVEEYQRALDRTLQYWTQNNKGKSLTQKEIRERGIREQVLAQLVDQKVMLNYADELGFKGGAGYVKYTLMNQYEEFKTNGKFDVSKYKGLLKANGISFKDFEADMVNQVKLTKLDSLLGSQQVSENFAKDMMKFSRQVATVSAASFRKEEMTKNLSVDNKEIEEFLKQENADVILNSLYDTYKQENIKKAKPLDEVKNELAAKHLKRKKREELKEFNEKLVADLKAAFEANNLKKIESLSKKYGFDFRKESKVNLMAPNVPEVELEEDKIRKLFTTKNTQDVLMNETPIQVSFVRAQSFSMTPAKDEDIKSNTQMSNMMLARSLNYKILQAKKKDAKITQASGLFQ
ncbi:MAG: hypothetical protein CME62_14590 [Halobacteriovoraceae bacterium]|nr:hypothetical protein [Halobacteriovoraceae bacterium]|tara:strand:+ start:12434 stop:13612 length:1179 start_codon:yes stop_codon:yes gene_type:complete